MGTVISYRKLLAKILVLASLGTLIFIYYPLVKIYLFQPEKPDNAKMQTGLYIYISKINAYASIIENVDPWDEKEYKKALKSGVAQAKGNENFLFAHSSLPPWEITRYNASFFRLGELGEGDEITLVKDGKKYIYGVVDKKEVWPNEVEYLQQKNGQLVLQTCIPLGTSFKRLLVFADLRVGP